MSELGIGLDAASMARLKKLGTFDLLHSTDLFLAMDDSLNLLEKTAQELMDERFMNPTGALAGNFREQYGFPAPDTFQGALLNDSPYAWRREEGFTGMTDSLGRFYPYDPGIHYDNDSLARDQFKILERFRKGVNAALDKVVL